VAATNDHQRTVVRLFNNDIRYTIGFFIIEGCALSRRRAGELNS